MKKQIAIVTGANRGLGFSTAYALAEKGYFTIFACRDLTQVLRKIDSSKAVALKLDVSDVKSIEEFVTQVKSQFGNPYILINNAGVFLDGREGRVASVFYALRNTIEQSFITNTLGPIALIQAFLPGMIEKGEGRIVNVSSGMGQLSEMEGECLGYRVSKTALNAVTRSFAAELRQYPNILINSVCPGWVKTEMGGPEAELEIEEGIKGIVWAATLPQRGPSGGFFRHGERLDW